LFLTVYNFLEIQLGKEYGTLEPPS